MLCENCNIEHTGSYGSGRFCSAKCARSYSTKNKREEINTKISKKLKGRPASEKSGFKKGKDTNRHLFTDADRKKATRKRQKRIDEQNRRRNQKRRLKAKRREVEARRRKAAKKKNKRRG